MDLNLEKKLIDWINENHKVNEYFYLAMDRGVDLEVGLVLVLGLGLELELELGLVLDPNAGKELSLLGLS
jgi:hypothetical protein